MWKNLAEGNDKHIHYIIALNKWFFYDKNDYISVKECADLCDRSIGSSRNALNKLADTYNLLNRNTIDSSLVFTPRKNNHGVTPLQDILKKYIDNQNSE